MEFEEAILKKIKEEARCAICGLLEDEEFDLLSKLQYRVTNEESVRAEIARENGFCDFHFRKFRKISRAQTNALLLLKLVDHYLQTQRASTIKCRLCVALDKIEQQLSTAMVSLLKNENSRKAFEESFGMCLSHTEIAKKHLRSNKTKQWLMSVQRRHVQQDIPALETLSHASYYDTKGEERAAIPRMIERFVGRRALGL
jgi:hypothetical protein